mmetsp:Transcript_74885/g.231533  ORF Transcript_74885/g.231533 Transcript_74885/m.231533 type:complete len:254 (-) Transcript_74885:5-766(-)
MAATAPPASGTPAAFMEAMESFQVDTPSGEVEVRLCLPAGERPVALALMVHGMSPERDVVWEWGGVVEELRRRNTASVYPNLHSCDLTAPARAQAEDVGAALEAIVAWGRLRVAAGEAERVPLLVYGKSWGGAQALELCARLAAARPAPAAGLCLACPSAKLAARAEKVASIAAPVLLVWAKDDDVIPFDRHEDLLQELRARPSGPTIFVPTKAGGHRVDRMAASDAGLAAKLAEWPDLALGPLAAAAALGAR